MVITIAHYADGTPVRKRIPNHVSDATPPALMAVPSPSQAEIMLEYLKCAQLNRPHHYPILQGNGR